MLTGLAVAFAFRCGLFNIGGQGQYSSAPRRDLGRLVVPGHEQLRPHHVRRSCGGAGRRGLGGIAGILKATVGAHEVITTIMLNWIAY